MDTYRIAAELKAMGRKGWMTDHRQNDMLQAAGRKLEELMALVDQQKRTIADLQARLADLGAEPDPEWPPMDEPPDDGGGDLDMDEIRFR